MINYEINVPFSIGDTVWVKKERIAYNQIECPFCKGHSYCDTGLTKITYVNSVMHREPWIIECKTCNGTGKISELSSIDAEWKRATVTGIYKMNCYEPDILYYVNYENTEDIDAVAGRDIYVNNPKEANKPEGGDA